MNISSLKFDINNNTLEIYVSGCNIKCTNCHNSHIWRFESGTPYSEKKEQILNHVRGNLVKNIWILGGEPLDQDKDELMEMIKHIRECIDDTKKIVLWTGYDINKVAITLDEDVEYFDYVKCGMYSGVEVEDYVWVEEIESNVLASQSVYKIEKDSVEKVK